MTKNAAIIGTLPVGRPTVIGGLGIERLRNGLYRVNRQPGLLTLEDAVKEVDANSKEQQASVPDHPIFPDYLRAMTTHFPWAWLMANGYKEEEYRHRRLVFPQVVLLHAGKGTASDWAIADYGIPRRQIKRGYILGAARVTACEVNRNRESTAEWAYQLADPVYFNRPVGPVSGKQAIFWKAMDTPTIRAFNRAWMQWEEAQ